MFNASYNARIAVQSWALSKGEQTRGHNECKEAGKNVAMFQGI